MNTLFDNPLVVRLGWTLLHFVWQGAVVGAVFATANGLARKASAQLRYTIAYGFLIFMAICPLVTFTQLKSPSASEIATPAAAKAASAQPAASNAPALARAETSGIHIPDKLADAESVYPAALDEPK